MIVCGLLTPGTSHESKKTWNQLFREKKMDAFFDVYVTKPCHCPQCDQHECLLLRFSEMYLHNRRGYVIDPSLQSAASDLVDRLTPRAKKAKKISVVTNEYGMIIGDWIDLRKNNEIARMWLREM